VLSAALQINSTTEFIQRARARPNVLNYGSVGAGSAAHLAMELFKQQAGIELLHVPYASFPQITTAMLAGDIQASFMVPAIAMPQAKEGKLKVLGVTSRVASASLPGVAPLAAQGFEGFEAISWHAMLAPAGTDPTILLRLQQRLAEILATPEIKDKFSAQYFSAVGSNAQVLRELMQTEKKRWDEVMTRLNLSLD
jgi:tripartite-type tricarboxylate transporter receptor subunit TctC